MSSTSQMNLTVATICEYAKSPHGISVEKNRLDIPEHPQSSGFDLKDHPNKIPRLEHQLQSPKALHESAQTKAKAFGPLIPPIHRLPAELFFPIFDYVCEDAISPLRYEPLTKVPFRLSAVCSRWRLLCLSYSRMWSTFTVNCDYGFEVAAAVDLYLERSKQQPLTLQLAYCPDDTSLAGHDVVFQKLISCCARWRHVMLQLQFLTPYLSGLDFPALECLIISVLSDDEEELDVFARSPKLQTLEARSVFTPHPEILGQITTLSYMMDTGNLHEMVALCPKLLTLVVQEFDIIHDWDWDDDDDDLDESDIADSLTVLPILTSLTVEGEGIAFRSFVTPALTTLKIEHCIANNDATCSLVERFLDRSGCSLTHLEIEAIWADRTVVGFLQRLPLLEELIIRDHKMSSPPSCSPPITKVFLESLHSRQPSHPVLVPKLHSLSLKVASAGFDHKSFVRLILSRWIPDKDYAASIGVSCIRSVKLHLPEGVDEAEYLPLVRLKKKGMHFDLRMHAYS